MDKLAGNWQKMAKISSRSYTCGYCSHRVASEKGDYCKPNGPPTGWTYVCPECNRPTVFVDDDQHPGVPPGGQVDEVPEPIEALYLEARRAAGAGAPTAAVLTTRKVLMNVAVQLGAEENKAFVHYVKWLVNEHHVPKSGEKWVDHIRMRSNEANHEIDLMTDDDADRLIAFAEMLLRLVYEFPSRVPDVEPPAVEQAQT